jgi:FlaA1/EpsC-like NDP-sugar epimerase
MRTYLWLLLGIDLLAGAVAGLCGYAFRFGLGGGPANGVYVFLSFLLPFVWVALVALSRAYEGRFLGIGAAEFQRIFSAFICLVAGASFISYATKAELARSYVLLALPTAVIVDVLLRYAARKALHRRRSAGQCVSSVLVVGDVRAVRDIALAMRRDKYAGLGVVGACLPDPSDFDEHAATQLNELGIPFLGGIDNIATVVSDVGAVAVAVTASQDLPPNRLRWIARQLEGSQIDLLVSPGLI